MKASGPMELKMNKLELLSIYYLFVECDFSCQCFFITFPTVNFIIS